MFATSLPSIIEPTHLVCVWVRMKNENYFTIQLLLFMNPIALFDIIHAPHCIISTNFYIYLQNFRNNFSVLAK